MVQNIIDLGKTRHQRLDTWADAVAAGSDGVRVLPYFLGEKTPIHDPMARGTFTGLGLHHGPGHLWRALLEGIAFGIRHHVEVFAEMGMPAERVLASDGGSVSSVWLQIIADVLGRTVQPLHGHPGSCLAAAWMAAIGAGFTTNLRGAHALVGLAPPVKPQEAHRMIYDASYAECVCAGQGIRGKSQPQSTMGLGRRAQWPTVAGCRQGAQAEPPTRSRGPEWRSLTPHSS